MECCLQREELISGARAAQFSLLVGTTESRALPGFFEGKASLPGTVLLLRGISDGGAVPTPEGCSENSVGTGAGASEHGGLRLRLALASLRSG